MNRKIIKDEINKNRKNAESFFAEWVDCRARILELKVLQCMEIAEALELALELDEKDAKIENLEKKIKNLEGGLEMALSLLTPEDERISILCRLLDEVRR